MADRTVFRRDVTWERGRPQVAAPQRPPWLVLGLVVGLAVVSVTFFAGTRLGSGHDPELKTQIGVIEGKLEELEATPTPEPTAEPCHDGAPYLEIVSAQELRAEWAQAYASARSALQTADLCRDDRTELARKAVANGLSANWATPADPASPAIQQAAIDRYRELEGLAGDYELSFPLSARQGAEQAYEASQFALAVLLIEEAAGEGQVVAADPLQARFAAAAYYNQGYHYALHGPQEPARDEGLRLLLTAHLIDREQRLGINEAWRLLSQLLGADERLWPGRIEPLSSAFLSADDTQPEAGALPPRLR